jgi:hypothetical protein
MTELSVGRLTRPQLRAALKQAGVQLNEAAETLLQNAEFDHQTPDRFTVVERTVRQLGLQHGATSPVIFATASELGLGLCPATTGPYLRLAALAQVSAPDSIMSVRRSPACVHGQASANATGTATYRRPG